jgi:hypothetical protein
MYKIRCPQCGNFSQTLPAEAAQVVACPHCGQRLRVPAARPESTPLPVAQAAPSASAPQAAPQAAPPAANDAIPEVAPVRPGERRFDEQPRERAPRRRDYDDDLPTRRRPGSRGAGFQPADPFASVQFGLGFFWWKNLLLIIAVLASFLPAGFSQMAGAGPIFAALVLLIVAVGGLGTVAALIFGAIGGVCCNRLPEELRHARGLASPLRTIEIVFPIVSLLSGLLLVPLFMLSRPRFIGQPAPSPGYELFAYGFVAFGVLAFLCWLATYVLLLLFLRTLAKHYGDEDTAASAMWIMISFLVAAVVGPVAVFVTALLSRMLGFGMVTAFIAISAVGIVVTVGWVWILFKIMQTITTVRRHLAQSMRA